MADPYRQFLESKVRMAPVAGFDVADSDVHALLKPHQRDIVRWAVQGGRRAIFAAFGLGKSVMQLEVLRLVLARSGGRALIIAPLGVRQEFRRDAAMLGMDITFVRHSHEVTGDGLYLTNYESVRDGRLDPNLFGAVSLDEASVLRSFGSKTYQAFLGLFAGVPFRFVATATPSPNRFKELIHYAGFLGIMDTGQALTRFFQRDSEKAGNLTLYPHKEREFWLWLNSWAIFLQRPSDLGYDDTGYDLPELQVHYHEVKVDHAGAGFERDGQGKLFRDAAIGVQDAAREKRDTLTARIEALQAILAANPDDHFILWHDLEVEREAIEAAIPGAVSVYGSQDLDEREQAIVDFSEGKFQYLAAKPVIAGSGCNFQRHCHKAVFMGIGFKFNDFIQSIHRIHRFLQGRSVEIHVIYAESEREVLRALEAKWAQHREMVGKMTAIIREHGLNHLSMAQVLQRSIGVERIEARGDGWLVANNDCVAETSSMDENSVDLIVTSIPFANHYEYTPSYNDFGHTEDNDQFWRQMDFLTPQLLRILRPGRIYACHVKDRILFGNVTGAGAPTVSPFHAEALFHGKAHGFDYMGMITVVTDVVRENNQTYRLSWSEQCKDGTKMGVGSPEYILLFRKPQTDRTRGYADAPVVKSKADSHQCPACGYMLKKGDEIEARALGDMFLDGSAAQEWKCPKCQEFGLFKSTGGYTRARWQVDAHAFWRSSGNRQLTPEELAAMPPDLLSKAFTRHTLETLYDYETHVRIGEALEARGALPATFMSLAPGSHHPDVWHDVNRMLTLNSDQSKRAQEQHVCPLQFDIVDRLIRRYSNEGDLVFDPFGGLFTVPYRALHLKRRGRASELNPGYFMDGVKYLQAAEAKLSMPDLFAAVGVAA